MDKLSENMSEILRKCKMLENYGSLHLRREAIIPNLQALKNQAENTEKTVNDSNKILEEQRIKSIEKYKNLLNRMNNQQLIILKLIKLIKERKAETIIEINSVRKPSQMNFLTPLAVKLLKSQVQQNTPKMCFSDYENSPYVRSQIRPTPTPLQQFLYFDAKITKEIFNGIPKYMRGRESLEELINFLDNILIPSFIEKYNLINKKRDAIKKSDELQLWNMYKAQISTYPNQKFITQGDLTRKVGRLIDKKIQTRITMLRHLRIINEERKSSTTFYIWLNNVDCQDLCDATKKKLFI